MSFYSEFDERSEIIGEINMTPLVDVMLVLLIIFMLTMPVLTHSVKVELPQAAAQLDRVKPETIALTVAQDGQVYWNEEPVAAAVLRRQLQAASAQAVQPEFRLRGDRKVAYEHVITLMAQVQQAGITRVGFVTDPAIH